MKPLNTFIFVNSRDRKGLRKVRESFKLIPPIKGDHHKFSACLEIFQNKYLAGGKNRNTLIIKVHIYSTKSGIFTKNYI